jgi:hypothetical protein
LQVGLLTALLPVLLVPRYLVSLLKVDLLLMRLVLLLWTLLVLPPVGGLLSTLPLLTVPASQVQPVTPPLLLVLGMLLAEPAGLASLPSVELLQPTAHWVAAPALLLLLHYPAGLSGLASVHQLLLPSLVLLLLLLLCCWGKLPGLAWAPPVLLLTAAAPALLAWVRSLVLSRLSAACVGF